MRFTSLPFIAALVASSYATAIPQPEVDERDGMCSSTPYSY